jgi:hypothetical protein
MLQSKLGLSGTEVTSPLELCFAARAAEYQPLRAARRGSRAGVEPPNLIVTSYKWMTNFIYA